MAMKQEIADVLLRLVGELEPASFRDLQMAAGLKEDTARQIVKDLRKRGCIDLLGGGRRAAWYIVGSEAHTAALALTCKIRERRESARRSRGDEKFPDRFVHRVVSVEESGVYVPRHAVASVWDLGRIAARAMRSPTMLPADVARCTGAKSVRGQPLPPCVLCERRVIPHGQRVQLMVPPIRREGCEWVCDMRIPYAQRVGA